MINWFRCMKCRWLIHNNPLLTAIKFVYPLSRFYIIFFSSPLCMCLKWKSQQIIMTWKKFVCLLQIELFSSAQFSHFHKKECSIIHTYTHRNSYKSEYVGSSARDDYFKNKLSYQSVCHYYTFIWRILQIHNKIDGSSH